MRGYLLTVIILGSLLFLAGEAMANSSDESLSYTICQVVADGKYYELARCENKEVVCYISRSKYGSNSINTECRFKEVRRGDR